VAISKYFSKFISTWLKHLLFAGLLASMMMAVLHVSVAESAQLEYQYEARSFNCSKVVDISTTECEALVALYDSTAGDYWFENENWLISTTVDNWFGVTVSGSHVTGLELINNFIVGTLPEELGDLSELVTLKMNNNQISGSIPSQLGDLSNLEILALEFNQITGSIPQNLENLSMIKELRFAFNELSGGIPVWLGNMTTLENLTLGCNPLGGEIPSVLGDLLNLTGLMLFNTGVTGSIPSELGKLDNLMYMHLNNNQLSGSIPPELGDMDSIKGLHLWDNQLEGSIPEDLGNLSAIWSLRLEENQLSGDIPDNLKNLTDLCLPGECEDLGIDYGLNLGYNHLNTTGLSTELSDYLAIYDPDWQSTQAVEEIITGNVGGSLTSTDGSTEIIIPSDAVEGEVTFTFEPQPEPDYYTGNLVFANNSFELTAQDSAQNPITIFEEPLTVTLHYDEEDLAGGLEEDLALYYRDEGQNSWLDIVTTCDGGFYLRNLDENWLSVTVCHLSEFALLGKPVWNLYLPLISK
jgi:hypothetical protein